MPRIEYVSKTFSAGSVAIIEQANAIIAEYQRAGQARIKLVADNWSKVVTYLEEEK
ncbi:MAG: hypothetical protein ACHQC8_02610 [Solirubrobacterales bacterium]